MAFAESVSAIGWEEDSCPSQHAAPVSVADQLPYFRIKAVAERGIGLLLLILAAPLIAVLVVAIRLTSRGPGVYRQARVGLGGRVFTMYKLRSMRCDAEAATGPVWAGTNGDPRVTPLGYWLRRLHLDELPQLWNIVRGEMSLVGPRPERPEFVSVLASEIPGYLDRLQVMPGITGLAQVNLPPDTDLASVRRKLTLDREYIGTASLLLDARLVMCTALRVVGLRGRRAVTLLGLYREVMLCTEELEKAAAPGTTAPRVAAGPQPQASTARRAAAADVAPLPAAAALRR